jgi:1,5-anhydro-D-fructose reductase (1,5-anhydro-D-mannitol-forming)
MVLVLEDAKAGWAVMGTGTIATENMVTAIRSIGHRVLWVVSQDKRDAAVFAQDLKISKFTTDLNCVLRDPAVAIFYVSAGPSRRPHYISVAAQASKHILCDGPIAVTSKAALAMVAACRDAGVRLAVNQLLRASTVHQTMRRLIGDGEIGRVQSVLIVRGGPHRPPQYRRAQDLDHAAEIHLSVLVDDIDLVRFLTGAELVEASALTSLSPDETSQIAYSMQFDNGALFLAQDSIKSTDVESLLMVVGERGTIVANGTLDGRSAGTLVRKIAGKKEFVPIRERDPHIAIATDFAGSDRSEPAWLAMGEDNVVALCAAEALRSSAQKRRPVAVSVGDAASSAASRRPDRQLT